MFLDLAIWHRFFTKGPQNRSWGPQRSQTSSYLPVLSSQSVHLSILGVLRDISGFRGPQQKRLWTTTISALRDVKICLSKYVQDNVTHSLNISSYLTKLKVMQYWTIIFNRPDQNLALQRFFTVFKRNLMIYYLVYGHTFVEKLS
jgi:hypothetical protein